MDVLDFPRSRKEIRDIHESRDTKPGRTPNRDIHQFRYTKYMDVLEFRLLDFPKYVDVLDLRRFPRYFRWIG